MDALLKTSWPIQSFSRQFTENVMAYSKLFSSIVHSSLWTEEDHVRLLFVTLLAIADREGFVYGSRVGLERLANIISEDYDRNPWEVLMEPDKDSSDLMRNPENEGRRIEQVPGGFRILNYCYYRSLRNEDDRREQNREAQHRYRRKISQSKPLSSQDKPVSASISQDKQTPSASASASASKKEEKKRVSTVRTAVHGLIDSEWIASLKDDKTYAGVDVNRELGKMQNWCKVRSLTPTRRRFVNWLNRDRPISDQAISPQHRQNRINYFNEKKQKINRQIKDPANPPSWAVAELKRIDEELQQL